MGKYLQNLSLLTVLGLTGGQTISAEVLLAQDQRGESLPPVAQIAQLFNPIQITNVQVSATEVGIEVALETTTETVPILITQVVDNALIIEIPNAELLLPEEDEFQVTNPTEGIDSVTVSPAPEGGVRVAITGVDAPPIAAERLDAGELVFDVTVDEAVSENIELIVTAEAAEEDYTVEAATTATRTETPIEDIPQSIQVVPEQVIEDQRVIRLNEALRNVSGVTAGNTRANDTETFTVRGFEDATILRDGIRQFTFGGTQETANLERVEVLKGPASIVFGAAEPGGLINVVTKKPLSEPFYEVQGSVGSYGFVEPRFDISGPLNSDETVLYRLNALYRRSDGFRNFDQEFERFFIAPVLTWLISDRTDLTVELEYLDNTQPYDRGLVAIGDEVADIPFDRIFHEPDDFIETDELKTGYRLEHEFNDDWTLRNIFRYSNTDLFLRAAELNSVNEDELVVNRSTRVFDIYEEAYDVQANLVGEFDTGSVEHELLVGFDFRNSSQDLDLKQAFAPPLAPPPISIFDPVYGFTLPPSEDVPQLFDGESELQQWGFYLQDLVSLTDNLKVLLSGRYDIADQDATIRPTDFFDASSPSLSDSAFSPRVGVVYQPTDQLSVYASFSRSFQPNDITFGGNLPEPERGTQYEIGAKAEFLDGRLFATLALYDLTKTNVSVPDPDNPGFSIALGEQQNQGIELDLVGEISPGWNVIASYGYIDAEITEGFFGIPEGGKPPNVAEHTASFWTTYELQEGDLQGLGFGIGAFFVGERFGDFGNTFTFDSYVRTDATIFYQRDKWRAALNFKNLFDTNYI
jgi:iron complex outermembrane receptor protein